MSRSIIEYRQARASDVQFVVRTWIDNYKSAHGAGILSIPEFSVPCDCGTAIRYDFSAVMEVTLARLLQRPGVTTWMAHNPRERAPHDLYGYLVSETGANMPSYQRGPDGESRMVIESSKDPLIHFVFVKQTYRKLGIARALLGKASIDPQKPFLYTCRTPNVSKLEKAGLIPESRWFPLSARFPKDQKAKTP